MSYPTYRRFFVLLTLVVMLTACGGNGGNEEKTESPSKSAPSTATATVEPTPTPNPTNTPEPTATPVEESSTEAMPGEAAGTVEGETPTASTEQTISVFEALGVNSYRSRISVEASGEAFEMDADTSPMASGNMEIIGEYVADPLAMHVSMTVGGETFAEYIVIGDQAWSRIPLFDANWMTATLDEVPDFTEIVSPVDLELLEKELSNIENVGTETIEGIETTHYRFDKNTLLAALDDPQAKEELQTIDTIEGDFWLAEGGIPIKWRMAFSGTGLNSDNPDAEGSMVVSYALSDFDAEFTIEPPEEASLADTLGIDLEIPASARKEFQFQQSVAYTLPDMTVQDAVNFFRAQLSAQGFEANDASSYQDETSALLQFESETQMVTLSVETAENGEGVSVFIAVEGK